MAQINAVEKRQDSGMATSGLATSGLVGVAADEKKLTKPTRNTLKLARDRDREMVKGVFKYYENQGGVLKFSIKLYKEDKVETYELVDGQIYTLPRGVARHLNTNTYYPVYDEVRLASSGTGIPEWKIKSKIFRTGFHPLDFSDVGDSEQHSQILTVER